MERYRDIVLRYGCDSAKLPASLAEAFVELGADASTRVWIDRALDEPQSRATTAMRDLVKQWVGLYDANALAGAFSMRVLGTDQWRTLVGGGPGRLLDVGAGDGEVTAELAPLYDEVITTELSAPMARSLRKRGWECHEVDIAVESLPEDGLFDVVSVLNVLDRTSFPLSLLHRVQALAAPGGRVVLAVPMPLSQVVLDRVASDEPIEPLPRVKGSWEAGVTALWDQTLAPIGFQLEALSRVPYLCRGDARCPVQVLDDAILVCSTPD